MRKLGVCFAIVLACCAAAVSQEKREDKPKADEKAGEPKKNVVTKAAYDALKTGISYKEAVKVIGREGEEISSSELAGIISIMYSWKNPDFSNMTAMFQNDKLTTKAQFGLK